MVTWSDVVEWQPSALDSANRSMDASHEDLVASADDIAYASNNIESTGTGADSAKSSLTTQQNIANTLVSLSAALNMATATAANGVADVQTKVYECITAAEIARIDISPDGAASISAARQAEIDALMDDDTKYGSATFSAYSDRDRVQRLIDEAIALAHKVDTEYADALDRILAGDVSGVETAGSFAQGLPDRPQPNWSEREVAAWWNMLTDAEKEAIIADDPDAIGNLDGVDATSRDRANRNRLPELIIEAEAAIGPLELEYQALVEQITDDYVPREFSSVANELRAARERLADLQAIESTLSSNNETSLLVLDTTSEDQVLAAVAVGNVDTAQHVATVVPGMTTSVRDSLEGYTDDAALMRNIASVESGVPLDQIATVAWLGYDAPQAPPSEFSVISTNKAQAGAANLAGFLEGVSASRNQGVSPDPNMSLFGHSYGSTTSGMAVRDMQVGVVDSLTMFGSPGSGVHDIREYNIAPEAVYVSAVDSHDSVQGMGPDITFGKNPEELAGITHLSDDDGLKDKPFKSSFPFPDYERHSTYFDVPTGEGETHYTQEQLQQRDELGFNDPNRNVENFNGSTTGILSDFGRIITGDK